MTDALSRQAVEAALERLLETIRAPRALLLRAEERVAIEHAVERTRVQLLDSPEPILTVVLAGGTGAGKSTLINALAQTAIAVVSHLRPTTTRPCIYHHREVDVGSLPAELTAAAVLVPHDRTSLRSKVIVDTPDLDSFATHHRAATRTLLKAAGLVLYVFSPQNYRDERTWSVLREEKRFSACAAVLNKVDLVTPDELKAITNDLRDGFARLDLPDIRLFRTSAIAWSPANHDAAQGLPTSGDDLVALRGFLEEELQRSDVANLLQRQQARVFAHLQAELDRLAPIRLLDRVDDAAGAASERLERAASRLYGALAGQLALVQEGLVPRVTLRQHERFWGPLRTWLAITDMLRFGLPGLVRRCLQHPPTAGSGVGEPFTAQSWAAAPVDFLREEAHALQSLLYALGLPIERWCSVTLQVDGDRLLGEIAATFAARLEALAAASAHGGNTVVWVLSTLGGFIPATFILIGLYVSGRDLLAGNYLGLPLLGHLSVMLLLVFLSLQSLASLLVPSGWRGQGEDVGRQVISEVLNHTVMGWLSTYRSDLEADLAALRAPLVALQSSPPLHRVTGGLKVSD
jgi:hypothetical protein